ncbi:MAG: hypothetical protein IJ131_07910 [Eggerthellaceae bacterium]|nr:hypothetical protein [Eggerthellaceae bacterium]
MTTYGEAGALDWPRIRKLFVIGLCASLLTFVADMLLGWVDGLNSTGTVQGMVAAYSSISDTRMAASALMGLVGIFLTSLAYFGVYRLLVAGKSRHAHAFRAGVIGYLAFGACGVHVPCLMAVYVYKHMAVLDAQAAWDAMVRFALYFMLPAFVLFVIFEFVMVIAQIRGFAEGDTPYPKWCAVLNIYTGMLLAVIISAIGGDTALFNGIFAAWISAGNVLTFAGLLATMPHAARKP